MPFLLPLLVVLLGMEKNIVLVVVEADAVSLVMLG